MSHSSWCTSAEAIRTEVFLDSQSRVLQFASYAFDISIADMLLTLLAGGCICVPSDQDRLSNVTGVINSLQVNWACLTSSVARIIDPATVISIKTLALAGEAIAPGDIIKWKPHVRLLNMYGPAECAISTTINRLAENEKDPNNAGRSTSAVLTWIADPQNYERLVPIGTVGELLVESPIIAREYMNDPARTAASFLEYPAWLREIRGAGSTGRLYRTGDLFEYLEDGSMRYVGRKDTQVKLRGQRVELGEVEYHVRQRFPGAHDVIVDVIQATDDDRPPTLMAFIHPIVDVKLSEENSGIFAEPSDLFKKAVLATTEQLDGILPVFMVPSIFIPLTHVPLTRTGKTDRRAVRAAAAKLTREQVDFYTSLESVKRMPATEAERMFQRLFSESFGLPINAVGVDDHFFRSGGDSIIAMALIPKAREVGYVIHMADVFNHPKLCDLAAAARSSNETSVTTEVAPFSLIGGDNDNHRHELVQMAAEQCNVLAELIEDIYPCTALQEGLIALVAKRPGHYVAAIEYELASTVNIDRFMAAWDRTADANNILRTRIIQPDSGGSLQVVINEPIPWQIFEDATQHEAWAKEIAMQPGKRLAHFALVQPHGSAPKNVKFHLTIHHSLYDGASLPRLWAQVEAAYNGSSLESKPFNVFVQSVVAVEGAEEFWRAEFEGLQAPIFPALPSSQYIPDSSTSLEHSMQAIQNQFAECTTSTAIQLAWAIVMSCYTNSEDVVFGLTVDGRSAPVQGIEDITGPTFATFPRRIQVRPQDSVGGTLAAIQSKTVSMMPYQQYGMQNMRRLGREAAVACDFQCHLAIQVPGSTDFANEMIVDARSKHKDGGAFFNYAFVIVCHLPPKGEDNILVTVSYDKSLVESLVTKRIIGLFEHVLRQLCLPVNRQPLKIGDIDLVSPEDRQQLAKWNAVIPPANDACLHNLVLRHALDRPESLAISAWDGDMTFRELESASVIMAQQLQDRGIQPGSLVPLLLDRSKWVVVAMLAVLRIGAACVTIDPKHPQGRIQDILGRTRAKFVLISAAHKISMMNSDKPRLITIPISDERPQDLDFSAPQVVPQDAAFVVFTSGSTGKPKGIVMEHVHVATSIRGFSSLWQLSQNTRGLHFSSYAFNGSIYEIFGILTNGGCVCIPSEFDRMNDILPFINGVGVNWALLTPAFMTSLEPDSIPTVRTIVLGGEAISTETVRTWASKVCLVNAYGSSEATVSIVGTVPETGWKHGTTGHFTSGVGWIIMPSGPKRIAPIGVPGELVFEGAAVTRGYLFDQERTAAVYDSNPSWLRSFRQQQDTQSRVYYSGDMVAYNRDGSIRYLGRRDTQVKLRGQRIELGEVEYQIRHSFPDVTGVVAEVVALHRGPPILVAFVANAHSPSSNSILEPPNAEFLSQVKAAARKLNGTVPNYMIPSLYLQLFEIPRAISGKADRQMLRNEAAALTQDIIQAYLGGPSSKRQPETEKEKLLQSVWAQTFKMKPEDISADDDFFHIGGDSIVGMRLTGIARRHGLHLPVSDIFRYPILSDQAAAVTMLQSAASVEYRPGSLLGVNNLATFFNQHLSAQVSPPYGSQDVEDILPTTEMQSSFINGRNMTFSRLHLRNANVDRKRLEAAFHALLKKHAILRSVFVSFRDVILQVVLRRVNFKLVTMGCDEELEHFSQTLCTQLADSPVPLGSLHFQPYLVSRCNTEHMIIVRMTHAQYDGVSFPLLSHDLTSAYNGVQLKPTPSFAEYLRYRLGHRKSGEAHKFWKEYLAGAEMTDIQALCRQTPPTQDKEYLVKPLRDIPLPDVPGGVTLATLVKAAWALILARATGRKDLVFGHLVNGRDAPLTDVDVISGPCITISPFRVSIHCDNNENSNKLTALNLLNHVQTQYMRSLPYANMDFRDIMTKDTAWKADTDFGSVVVHQDGNADLSGSIGNHADASSSTGDGQGMMMAAAEASQWKTMDLGIQPQLYAVTWQVAGEAKLRVQLAVSSHRLHPADADLVIDAFCRAIEEVSSNTLVLVDL
ncbi:hypothetical protein F4679DRAFT_587147 [Xylaria curta]|nr:hypothetical protein F4679DRAFT_587147 [Xylaria curta]